MPADCPRVAIPVHMVPVRWHLQHMTQTDGRMCHCKRLHFQIKGVGQTALATVTHVTQAGNDIATFFIIQMPGGGV